MSLPQSCEMAIIIFVLGLAIGSWLAGRKFLQDYFIKRKEAKEREGNRDKRNYKR